eukprot:jgi/Chlat1/8346/Chrsp8S08110
MRRTTKQRTWDSMRMMAMMRVWKLSADMALRILLLLTSLRMER